MEPCTAPLCTCFGFHFYDFNLFAENIGSALGNPFVHTLCHW